MSKDHLPPSMPRRLDGFNPDVLLLEDFEGAINWTVTGTGVNFGLDQSAVAARSGRYGARLYTRPLTPAALDQCQATRDYGLPHSGRETLSIHWAIPNPATCYAVVLAPIIYIGTGLIMPTIYYRPPLAQTYILDAAGLEYALPGCAFPTAAGAWQTMYLDLDLNAHCYLAAGVHGVHVDLAGMPCQFISFPTTSAQRIQFGTTAAGAAQTEAYFDDLLVYAQEAP